MSEVGLMLYPWDVVADGPERVVDEIASRGASRIEIATAYHSAEAIAPRRDAGVVTVAEANTLHLPVPAESFSDVRIPQSRIAEQHPDLYERLAEAAGAAGLSLGGWAIAFHNSSLASEHPEAAITSCFGDTFTHGLCPANPSARHYAVELIEAVASSGYFDRLLVESLSYLLYSHGHPHELWGARLDATTRYLLSLCFCRYCTEAGASRGIDVDALRQHVAAHLSRSWNQDFPHGRDGDDGSELASLHHVWPELHAYTQMRMERVTALATDVIAAAHKHGVLLDVSAAVWGRPAQMNWLEGVDVVETLRVADGFVLESYHPGAGEVAREIDHTLALRSLLPGNAADINVALTLWQSLSRNRGDFSAKVETVAASGVQRLSLYNYGTATRATLDWIDDAVEIMGSRA